MIYLATDARRHKVRVGRWQHASSFWVRARICSLFSPAQTHTLPHAAIHTLRSIQRARSSQGEQTSMPHSPSYPPLENTFPGTSLSPAVWEVPGRRRRKKGRWRSLHSQMGPGQQPGPPRPLLKGCCLQTECNLGLGGLWGTQSSSKWSLLPLWAQIL